MKAAPIFRFDPVGHRYYVDGQERPHVTGMLDAAGLIDTRFMTAESRVRGSAVHQLSADFDLDALDVDALVSPYKGFLLAYRQAMSLIPHTWDRIEQPRMHPVYLYGCRTDRVGRIYGAQGVLEIKSGELEDAHAIQTALQVMAESAGTPIACESWWRGALYLKPNGKWKLIEHTSRRDFDEADRLVTRYCPAPSPRPALVTADSRRGPVPDRRRSDRDGTTAQDRRASGRRAARA